MAKDLLINYDGKPSYTIAIREDYNDLQTQIKSISKNYDKVCIVTDSNVEKYYLNDVKNIFSKIFSSVTSFTFKAGEESKNLATVESLYEFLIQEHFTRKSLLVALGGGVVGDLTGFAASTYLRGIDFIQMPTTLLSQVDSSIGGKTGVDFLKYKNMVGAFYMPKLVYMNLNTLKTLDAYNFACGMGEVIKSGLIQNRDFYEWLKDNCTTIKELDFNALETTVFECCKIKGNVVEIDPKEQGIRSYLNFGHTIGHAIEKLSNFKLGHGQCVGIGMVAAAYLSKKLGYLSESDCNDIIATIKKFDLPVKAEGLVPEEVLFATKSDKKMSANKIKFVVLKSIGQADNYTEFTDNDLLEGINYVL